MGHPGGPPGRSGLEIGPGRTASSESTWARPSGVGGELAQVVWEKELQRKPPGLTGLGKWGEAIISSGTPESQQPLCHIAITATTPSSPQGVI